MLVVKKSPIVIVKTFLFLEALAVTFYFVSGLLIYYARIYRGLPIADTISFQLAQAILIFGVESVLLLYSFFSWLIERYEFTKDQCVHTSGIIHRRVSATSLQDFSQVTWRQSLIGRLARYGSVELTNNEGNKKLTLNNVHLPERSVQEITTLKNGHSESHAVDQSQTIQSLLQHEEHEQLEFKTTFRWDMKGNKVNKLLEKASMKTVAAFLNSSGGHLVLGVNDAKEVVGLEYDYASLGKQNSDGFENHFSHIFQTALGAEFRRYVHLSHTTLDDKRCCLVRVEPSPVPVYLKSDGTEEFYIRTGNATTSLKFSEATNYIRSKFKTI